MSISFYGMENTKNIGCCNPKRDDYDLVQLVVVRLGDRDYQSEGQDLLEFLSTIFYPHGPEFGKKLGKYIDVESSIEKEAVSMTNLYEWFYQDGIEEGIGQGREEGIEAFILDNLEENICEERIIEKLQRRFRLKEEEARAYFKRFALVKQ